MEGRKRTYISRWRGYTRVMQEKGWVVVPRVTSFLWGSPLRPATCSPAPALQDATPDSYFRVVRSHAARTGNFIFLPTTTMTDRASEKIAHVEEKRKKKK